MSLGLIGRKVGMTRIFAKDGTSVPVTVLEVVPNRVTQIKNINNDVIELAITDADAFTNPEKSEADANKIHKTAVKQANKEIGI